MFDGMKVDVVVVVVVGYCLVPFLRSWLINVNGRMALLFSNFAYLYMCLPPFLSQVKKDHWKNQYPLNSLLYTGMVHYFANTYRYI